MGEAMSDLIARSADLPPGRRHIGASRGSGARQVPGRARREMMSIRSRRSPAIAVCSSAGHGGALTRFLAMSAVLVAMFALPGIASADVFDGATADASLV